MRRMIIYRLLQFVLAAFLAFVFTQFSAKVNPSVILYWDTIFTVFLALLITFHRYCISGPFTALQACARMSSKALSIQNQMRKDTSFYASLQRVRCFKR
jgi:hypothetical protein